MKKVATFYCFYFSCTIGNAQETQRHHQTLDKRKSFTFNQSAYNKQWLYGGTSNMAGNFGINYDFNYKRVL
jgi:hypothetical protein